MKTLPILTFRNVERSPAIEELIYEQIEALEEVFSRIIGCEVVLHSPQNKKATGRMISVKLTVRIPGPDIRVERRIGKGETLNDIKIALRRAFDTVKRDLREQARKMGRVEVKAHPQVLHGTIDRLFEGEGYGFINCSEGSDVYFDQESLTTGSWEDLQVDMKVRFRKETGNKGTFATNVAPSVSVNSG